MQRTEWKGRNHPGPSQMLVVRSLHLSEGHVDDIKLRNTQLQKTEVILVRYQGWVTCGENPCYDNVFCVCWLWGKDASSDMETEIPETPGDANGALESGGS